MSKAVVVVLGILLAYHGVSAEIPRTLSYQGILTDSATGETKNGTFTVTFSLYTTSSGGSHVWMEQKTVTVKNGLFSTILGDQVLIPSTLRFDDPYWLGIKVGVESELSPRVPLTSVAYSLNAQRADTARYALSAAPQTYVDSARIASTVPNNAVTSSKILDGAVSTSKIANAAVTSQKIASGQVVKSLNSLSDDVTLVAGANVTITPSANSLVIAAPDQGFVDSARIASTVPDNAITSSKLLDGVVSTGKIATAAITSPKIASGQVVKSINTRTDNVTLVAGSNVTITPNGDSLVIAASSGQSSQWTTSGNNIYYNIGNVGIGTTSPTALLHLRSTGTDAYQGLALSSSLPDGKTLTINQGTAGKINFTNPGVVDLMTMTFVGDTNRIGIKNTNPLYDLDVNGTIRANNVAPSDARYKVAVESLGEMLPKVRLLRGVHYEFDHDRFPAKNFPRGKQIGLIAQEIESVFPEIVSVDGEGYRSVDYGKLGPILIEALKELTTKNDMLSSRVEELQQTVKRLLAEREQNLESGSLGELR